MQTRTRSRSSAIVSDRDGSSSRLNQQSALPTLSSSSSPVSSMQRGATSSHHLYSNSYNNHGHSQLNSVPTSEAAVPHTSLQQSRPIATLQPGAGTSAGSRLRSGSNPLYYRGLPMSSTNSSVAAGGDYPRESNIRIDLSTTTTTTTTTTRNRSHSPLEPTSFRVHAKEISGSRNRVSLEPTAPTLRGFGVVNAPGTGTRARAATSSEVSGRGTPSISLSPSSPLLASPPPQPRYATKPASSALYTSSSSTATAAKPSTGHGFAAASTNNATVTPSSQHTAKSTSVGSEGAQGAQGSSPLPPTSAVDQEGRRLRELQLQGRFKAAQSFIERTVGQPLPSSDLHESLKDGVILCRLANRLRPGTVEQISLKNLPFVKMENISNFLNAAKQLGVQSSDLFQTVDLYEGKDMTQVVSTILTLERVLGGVARMVAKDKRPGPSPIVSAGSTPSQIAKVGALGPAVVTRMRSKTAHTPSTASTTASIRPSSSAYYAAQVRKLEEDSIRFAHGYDLLEANAFKPRDPRYQSTPMIGRAVSPSSKGRVSHQPSLSDIQAGLDRASFGSDETPAIELEAENRREQRALVFGRDSPATMEQSTTIAKSVSGSTLSADGRMSSLDMIRRKKKSISLDPQAANAVMGNPSYRDGLGSPGSPGLLTQSASYSAISHLHSPGTASNAGQMTSLKQHTRFSSERTLDGTVRTALGSPSSSRSTTPVQGLRKSANSVEPLREKLELLENDALVATFQLGNCIGRGQFGSVYKALNLVTGQMVAVKRIKIDGLKENQMDMLMQEVDLLKSLAHPSIVKYEGFIMTYGYLNIILEFVENGSLLTTLKSFGTFPEKLVVAYVVKILEGLVYLHGKQVVHCDLKAANILTTKNGNVKLSDFGVSLNLKVKESDFGAVAGTPNWMAPEVIELKGASPASDIWSLGCTIVEMLTGRPPYADLLAMTTLFRIVEDERPPLPSNLSVDLLDFLCQCFQKDPSRRPSAGTLGRHVWIKRNFASKELKPMDSLPYMKRKSMEPREKVLLAATLETNAAKRSSTPLGLSSGVPPPSPSAVPIHGDGRGTRRRSVDSVSGLYASSTVPAPTHASERQQDQSNGGKTTSHHQFVKSSFAKPVECRLCHDYVKKQAVICQDCSMVFHRKCQFYVGDTCFPAPHLSYFQTPTPAQSVPNLKMMMGGKPKGTSRPSSRTSVLNLEDRSRSVTPSHGAPGRPCPTPPLTLFPKRESATIDERIGQRLPVSAPPTPLYLAQRSTSPDVQISEGQSRVPRPSSRQSDSPTSPTALSNLRNLITGPRRFSFGTKKASSATASHPLPTPPTSYTSTAPAMSSLHTRHHSATPDSGKAPFQQRSPAPATPPKSLPVPIMGVRGGASGSSYRNQEHVPGLFDQDDNADEHDGRFNYERTSQRPSSISLFSSSAPPVHGEYQSRMMGRTSVASTASCPEEDEEEEGGVDEYRVRGVEGRPHEDVRDMSEQDLEALLIPSTNRSPRLSLEFGGHYRTRSQSISQTLSQSIEQPQDLFASGSRPSSAVSFGVVSNGRPSSQQQQYVYSGRPQLNNGYQSSGSSSAAMTSSYSSHSNKSSSASSVGSVAALLEEEERMLKEMKQNQGRSGTPTGKGGMLGVPSAFQQQGTQPPQAHHVGIKTMLSRFSASSKDSTHHGSDSPNHNNSSSNNHHTDGRLIVQDKDQQKTKSAVAYAAAARHQIQAPGHYQQPHSQPPSGLGVRAVHPIPFQSNGESATSKSGGEFSQGHHDNDEVHEYRASTRTGYKNGALDQGARPTASGWRPLSSQDFHDARPLQHSSQQQQPYAAAGDGLEGSRKKAVTLPMSLPGSTMSSSAQSVPVSAAAAAASALRRGGKVIRRSMAATVEKDRWD
ncbi:unnamed protein product [Mortierella alpina]